MRNKLLSIITAVLLLLPSSFIFAQEGVEETMQDSLTPADTLAKIVAVTNIETFDTPNDAGENVTIQWKAQKDELGFIIGYEIFRSENKEAEYKIVGFVGKGTLEFKN